MLNIKKHAIIPLHLKKYNTLFQLTLCELSYKQNNQAADF